MNTYVIEIMELRRKDIKSHQKRKPKSKRKSSSEAIKEAGYQSKRSRLSHMPKGKC